jgi:hypothetical protein
MKLEFFSIYFQTGKAVLIKTCCLRSEFEMMISYQCELVIQVKSNRGARLELNSPKCQHFNASHSTNDGYVGQVAAPEIHKKKKIRIYACTSKCSREGQTINDRMAMQIHFKGTLSCFVINNHHAILTFSIMATTKNLCFGVH